jgi:hypothetical protein
MRLWKAGLTSTLRGIGLGIVTITTAPNHVGLLMRNFRIYCSFFPQILSSVD